MDADCRIEIGIGRREDRGLRGTRREPGSVDASFIDRVVANDLAGDAGDQQGLALAAGLVARTEPVPAFGGIGRRSLFRIGHKAVVPVGAHIHPGAGSKIIGRLSTTVQHDNQWQRLAAIAARHEELIGAAAGLVAVGLREKPSPVRYSARLRRRRPRHATRIGRKADAGHPVQKATQRFGQLRSDRALGGIGHLKVDLCPPEHALQLRRALSQTAGSDQAACFTHAERRSVAHRDIPLFEGFG